MSDAVAETNSWLIKRNCSAGPGQLAIVFGSLVAVSFAFGVGFAAFGLWMVLPFVGIELIAVGAAFVCYGWHAADFERIEIARDGVFVEHVVGDRRHQWKFEPRVSHVQIESSGRKWGRRVRVYLQAPGTKLELGRYLLDPRRLQLGREISGSLMRARTGAL
jgi:uncharacterized membrane protein